MIVIFQLLFGEDKYVSVSLLTAAAMSGCAVPEILSQKVFLSLFPIYFLEAVRKYFQTQDLQKNELLLTLLKTSFKNPRCTTVCHTNLFLILL